jgi:hypothetical protein
LTLGVMALIGMPAAIAAAICADEVVESVKQRAEQVKESWQEQRALDRLERAFASAPPAGPPWAAAARVASEAIASARDTVTQFAAQRLTAAGFAPGWLPVPAVSTVTPPQRFEEIVASLRELPRAHPDYDAALVAACHCLSISEHLAQVSGLDMEIERLRMEGALAAAGVRLTDC